MPISGLVFLIKLNEGAKGQCNVRGIFGTYLLNIKRHRDFQPWIHVFVGKTSELSWLMSESKRKLLYRSWFFHFLCM